MEKLASLDFEKFYSYIKETYETAIKENPGELKFLQKQFGIQYITCPDCSAKLFIISSSYSSLFKCNCGTQFVWARADRNDEGTEDFILYPGRVIDSRGNQLTYNSSGESGGIGGDFDEERHTRSFNRHSMRPHGPRHHARPPMEIEDDDEDLGLTPDDEDDDADELEEKDAKIKTHQERSDEAHEGDDDEEGDDDDEE